MRIKNLPSILSMDGSQDALVIEQTDGSEDKSRKVSPAQIKQYVLGNSIDDIYSVMGQNGAKNLIPYPYNGTTQVNHGVTFTVNNDGTVIANGTANGIAQLYLVLGDVALSAAGNLVINTNKPLFLSGCPSGGGNTTYRIQYGLTDGTTYWAKTASDTGRGVKITPIAGLNSYCFVVIKIMVFDGCTVNNLTFKPMLRYASDTDNTYQPYAKTNRQLTDELSGKQDTLTFDNAPTASSTNPVTSGGVKTYVDDLIKTQYLETNISTLSGNSSTTIAISFDAPAGYKAIGVSEVLTSSTAVAVTGFYTERNSSLKVKCSNLYSAAVSNVTVGVSLIYVRI